MKSLVEAIANIVLFILTPMIVGVGTDQLSSGHREHRELPVEESETRAVYRWARFLRRLCLTLSRSCVAQTAADRSHSGLAKYPVLA
jgi:hypothetical protein